MKQITKDNLHNSIPSTDLYYPHFGIIHPHGMKGYIGTTSYTSNEYMAWAFAGVCRRHYFLAVNPNPSITDLIQKLLERGFLVFSFKNNRELLMWGAGE